jgi:hypothetical protein
MRSLFVLSLLSMLTLFSVGAAGDTDVASCLGASIAQNPACCKANKGICGCRAGKIVCCDKTFAAGCTCGQDEPITSL